MTDLAEDVFQLLALPNQDDELINLDVAALLTSNDSLDADESWLGDESNWLECFDFDDSEDVFLPATVKDEDDDVIGVDGAVCKLPRCLSLGSIASSEIGSVGSSTSTITLDSTINRPIQPKPTAAAPKLQPIQQMRMVACKPPLVKTALDIQKQQQQQPRRQQKARRRSPMSSAHSTCSNTSSSTSTTSSGSNSSEDDTSTDDGKKNMKRTTHKILIARRLPSHGLSPKPSAPPDQTVSRYMSHPVATSAAVSHITCHTAPVQSVVCEAKKAQPNLSVAEQRRVKRQEKMARNRELAAESRIRRKRLLEDLTKENELLRARLAVLEGGSNLEGAQSSENSKRARIDDGLPMHLPSREISIQTDESWLMQTTKVSTAAVGLVLSAVLVGMDTSDVGTGGNGGNGTAFEVQLIAVWAMLAEFMRSMFGTGNTIVPTLDHHFRHGHIGGSGNGHVGMHTSDVRWLIWTALLGASLLLVVAVAGLAWMTKARKASMMYYEPEWQQINPWRKSQKCLG